MITDGKNTLYTSVSEEKNCHLHINDSEFRKEFPLTLLKSELYNGRNNVTLSILFHPYLTFFIRNYNTIFMITSDNHISANHERRQQPVYFRPGKKDGLP
jgi:hypothetical protein